MVCSAGLLHWLSHQDDVRVSMGTMDMQIRVLGSHGSGHLIRDNSGVTNLLLRSG